MIDIKAKERDIKKESVNLAEDLGIVGLRQEWRIWKFHRRISAIMENIDYLWNPEYMSGIVGNKKADSLIGQYSGSVSSTE